MIPLSEDMKSVLRRWNSGALDEIERARVSRPAGVHLTGTAGSGKSELRRELSRLVGSAIEFTDSVADAAVVMIVVDASAPVGRVEVEQWRAALESTPVVFVVNKIDVHRHWREVVSADTDVVAECVPRAVECTFHPISVRLARMGRESGDAAMSAESGLGAVADRLGVVLLQTAALGTERKYAAAVQDCASGARASIVARARAVTGGSDTAELRARRAELVGERDNLGGDRRALLHNRIQRVRVESVHTAAEDFRALTAEVKRTIDGAGRAELTHLPAHVAESARGARNRADAALTARLRAVETELGLTPRQAESVADAPLDIGEPSRRRGVEDVVMIVVGASAGVGLGRLVVSPMALVPAWAVANTVITLVLGGALAWWITRSRSLVADRAHLRGWTQETVARVKSSVEQRLLSRILDAESMLAAAVASADRDAVARIDVALAEVDAELRRLADHRSALLSACDRDLSALERGLERFRGSVPLSSTHGEPFDEPVRRSQ
ncbi:MULTISPECIES: hypothetical protein [unclassified Rhodococcus (in: high G+C Gram-positive bacteria)]|uniref:hypothetical protein n=1 Tax=unclassified Rhodococcus (in: high G+C Gram-positive bacteria) TaxID=192944 RepID=UPI000B9C27A3|nr:MULTISPECIES: hypothetical protein [unclassified Rhodococcus (in: high G+C Gram-positive bacteria)]OZE38514.1 hypothetical protein CH259_08140 [Rhodococcus sp. 05-2254-4]OZE47276.1 hypothetical protein CH283_19545 [Rhodococcus sp. 05-2254-2]OZE51175.1 hypothetical protein CH261_00825 [Rhodococcus sp. 05-2254-3]